MNDSEIQNFMFSTKNEDILWRFDNKGLQYLYKGKNHNFDGTVWRTVSGDIIDSKHHYYLNNYIDNKTGLTWTFHARKLVVKDTNNIRWIYDFIIKKWKLYNIKDIMLLVTELSRMKKNNETKKIIHYTKILLKNTKSIKRLKTSVQGTEWLTNNPDIYTIIELDSNELYNSFLKNVNDKKEMYDILKKYQNVFINTWENAVDNLRKYGICRLNIELNKTIVTIANLTAGWTVKNTENRYTDSPYNDLLVYNVLSHGIIVDSKLIRPPVVNVYTFKK